MRKDYEDDYFRSTRSLKSNKSKRLVDKYHLNAILTGKMLGKKAKEKDTFKFKVQEYMNK